MQWGNVHLCMGKRLMDKAASEGRPLSEIAAEAEALFDKAEDRYNESLRTKADFYDGAASIANLFFERGRLAANFALAPPKRVSDPDTPACAPCPAHALEQRRDSCRIDRQMMSAAACRV